MKNVKKIIAAALITMLATSLMGCNMIEKTPEGISKSVVAKAFDAKITRGQVDEQLANVIKQLETKYGPNYKTNAEAMTELTKLKQQVVEGLLTEKIVNYKAKELKLMPTEAKLKEETNKRLAEIKKSLGTNAKYKEALAQEGLTEKALKARIKPEFIQEALFADVTKNVKVTEDQEKAYYNANKTQLTEKPNTIHAAHIIVATEPEAIAIKKRLDAGEDFAKVAKEKGTDATKENGGDLGDIPYNDAQMDKTFMAAAIALPKGKISAPVKTQYGWHIIKAIDKKEYPVKKFTAAKAEVEKMLIKQGKESAWTDAMTKWKKEANIKQYPKNL